MVFVSGFSILYTILYNSITLTLLIAIEHIVENMYRFFKLIFVNSPINAKRAEKNMMFIGVCAAALFVIPGVCSAVIKPMMDAIGLKAPDQKHAPKPAENPQLTVITPANNRLTKLTSPYTSMHAFQNRPQSGLRVGGL